MEHSSWFLRAIARQVSISLFLTIITEGTAMFFLGWRTRREQSRLLLVNVVTNPVVVTLFYLFYYYGPDIDLNPLFFQLVLECGVVVAEWLLFRALLPEKERPFLTALALNFFSWGLWYALEKIVRSGILF